MGIDFVTELAKSYHSHAGFYITHQSYLARFPREDPFGNMCIPTDHMRYVLVRMDPGAFDQGTGRVSSVCEPYSKSRSIYTGEVAKFEILKNNRLQKGSRLRIRVISNSLQEARMFEEALVPLVYSLKRKGWYVECQDTALLHCAKTIKRYE
jgi:hypothetical protein